MLFNRLSVLTCLVLLFGNNCQALTTEETAKLNSYIETMVRCQNITGLSIAVAKHGETFTAGFGYADRENLSPVTSSTKMNIGSVTKTLTSIVWAKLISDAKDRDESLDWNSKLDEILEQDIEFNDQCLSRTVALEDFMSHRTGLESADIILQAGIPGDITRDAMMRKMEYLQSAEEFRDVWCYSNIGYMIVGYLMEQVYGKSWETTMREVLFSSLQMTSSTFLTKETFQTLATPYTIVKGEGIKKTDPRIYQILDQFGPAGSICTTGDDISKLLTFLTDTENSNLTIRKEVFDKLFQHKSILPENIKPRYSLQPPFPVRFEVYGYGMAWFLAKYRDYDMYFHTGNLYGFSSVLGYIPSKNISVFLNSNGLGESGFLNTILPTMHYMVDILLGHEPWLNESTACTFPSAWKEAESNSSSSANETHIAVLENKQRFVGNYSNPLYGDVTVSLENETLTVSYGQLLRGTLSYYGDFLFNMTILDPLADVFGGQKYPVSFENFDGNVLKSVRLDKYAKFDRMFTTTNTANKLTMLYLLMFLITGWPIWYNMIVF